MPKSYKCFHCPRITKLRDRYAISKKHRSIICKLSGRTPDDLDFLCNKCRHICRSHVQKPEEVKNVPPSPELTPHQLPSSTSASPPSVQLPSPSTARGHAACCICKRPGPKLVVVPVEVRHRMFISKEIIIPAGSRCCPNHLQRGNLDVVNPIAETPTLNRTSIAQLIKFLRRELHRQENTRLDFDNNNSLSVGEFINLLGISKDSFHDLTHFVEGRVHPTPKRSVRTSLAIFFWMKLRGGESNKVLSTLFNVSKSNIRRCVNSVRSALVTGGFVSTNIGFQHITRGEIINKHTRKLAHTLFGTHQNEAILVLDGTYIYINKSGNFRFQRQSFSFHIGRPLVKPMIIVSTTGYFISVMGPNLAKNNDAGWYPNPHHEIKPRDIRNWVRNEDIFVVGRGFRDSIDYLEELGIKAKMPAFFTKGEKQLSTKSANISRLVTKIRWKYLSHILPSNQIRFIGDFVRIVCALCKRYLLPLAGDTDDDMAIGSTMLYLPKQSNTLQQLVEDKHLDRRLACWVPIEDLTDFPYLDEDQLRSLTCGTYRFVSPPAMPRNI